MRQKTAQNTKKEKEGLGLKHMSVQLVFLFLFWLVLSGRTEAQFLVLGFLTALIVTVITAPLLKLSSLDGTRCYQAFALPYKDCFCYCVWLLGEIIKANIDLARIILSPHLPINPHLVTFKKPMNNPVAHAVLGNSITLTPGTVTVDIREDGTYVIHALTDSAAASLIQPGEDEMVMRVSTLFQNHN